jgi:hypothetical protein
MFPDTPVRWEPLLHWRHRVACVRSKLQESCRPTAGVSTRRDARLFLAPPLQSIHARTHGLSSHASLGCVPACCPNGRLRRRVLAGRCAGQPLREPGSRILAPVGRSRAATGFPHSRSRWSLAHPRLASPGSAIFAPVGHSHARARATRLAIKAAVAPAPTPLSMFTTVRPGAHVWSIESRAATPFPPRP